MTSGNVEQVARALAGITGVDRRATVAKPDRYIVVARMNRELDTVDSLRRNSYRACWPSYQLLRPTRQRVDGRAVRRVQRVGIIPGYVFSEVNPHRDFLSEIDRIVGAIDVVWTASGTPLLIRDDDIQIMRRIEIGLNLPRADKVVHEFKPGDRVAFIDDLLSIWPPGRIVKLERDGRIIVEVDLMGQKVPVTALPHQIERM